jgi:hypothetical protein
MKFKKDREYWFNRTANVANAIRDLEERIESGTIHADFYREEQPMLPHQRKALTVRIEELKREQVETHREFIAWNKAN